VQFAFHVINFGYFSHGLPPFCPCLAWTDATADKVHSQLITVVLYAYRWFLENDLLLNGSKSETIIIGTTVQLKSADAATTTVSIAGASLPISKELKSLGVILDDHLRFDSHVRAVVKVCAYHTHALRHVQHLLTTELATTIACSIVATRLDYCNSLLYGAPVATLDKLQRAQNNLARVVTCSARRSSAKPLLESLHWLPVRQRCIYKLATLTYRSNRPPRRLIFIHYSFHMLLLVRCTQAVRRG